MTKPRVSVLMVTYNRSEYIAKSIDSVLAQTFPEWELIIVDDSENELTAKVVEPYVKKDKRIKYFHRPQRGNIASASNFGLEQCANTEYGAILDDDDYWMQPLKLHKQLKFLDDNKSFVGCGGGMMIINKDGKEERVLLKPEHDSDIRAVALYANPIVNSTSMFRRKEGGSFDASLLQFADWDFWLKIGLKGKLYNFPEPFLAYRIWEGSASFRRQEEIAVSAVRIVKRYSNDYPHATMGYLYAYGYRAYVLMPRPIRGFLNPIASRARKYLFSS